MPRVADADRKRARRPKTKTGCTTCKIRRVKCDEARPECHRCTSTGRTCDGYTSTSPTPRPPKPAKKTPSQTPSTSIKLSRSASPIAIQPSSVFATDRERQAFSYFLTRTSPQMAGFYTCDFWNHVLPQAAHVDAGIRHAIVALSSVHRLFEERGDTDGVCEDPFGMQHYQLAIRRHIEDMQCFASNLSDLAAGKGREGLQSYLASSMLFICIEMLHGHYLSAISLTKAAVRLFYDYIVPATYHSPSPPHTNNNSTPYSGGWPLAVFESYLARLQAKSIGLVGRTAVGAVVAPKIRRIDPRDPPLPTKFPSIAAARDWYDGFHWAHTFSSHDPDVHGAQDDLRDPVTHRRNFAVMERWSAAFGALLADLDFNRLGQRDRNAIAVLQVRRQITQIAFEMTLRDELADCNPMLWDAYTPVFRDTLARLETVLRTQDADDRIPGPASPLSTPPATIKTTSATGAREKSGPRHLFTLDFGLVGPLYELARLSRDPALRRRAIALLRAHPMREGMWDSLLAARAAEAQMELEEGMAERARARYERARNDGRAGQEGDVIGEVGWKPECAADIPRDCRIICLLPDMRPGRRWARTFFSRLPARGPADDRPREWHFEQVIEW